MKLKCVNQILKISYLLSLSNFGKIFSTTLPPYQSAFGELLTVESIAIVQMQYVYGTLNPNYVLATGANGGTVTVPTNLATLATSTSATGVALLRSKARLHYQPGQGCESLFTALFTAGVSGSSQQIGLGNLATGESGVTAGTPIQDGFFYGYFNETSFSYTGATGATYYGDTFGIIHTCNQRTYFYPQSSWNVDTMLGGGGSSNPSGITLDPTKGNVYKIQYQWLGFGLVGFFIENPTTGSINLVHAIQYSNAHTITTLLNPTLQLMAKVAKTSGASNISLQNPSFAGLIQGYVNPDHDERNMASTSSTAYALPNNSPTFNNVLTIQNKTTFNGIVNQVEVFPDWISIMENAAATTEVLFYIYLNTTFSATLTYTDVSTTTSVMSYAAASSGINEATITGGTLLGAIYLVGKTNLLFSLAPFALQLEPGDILSVAATRITGAGSVLASFSWLERF